MMRWRSESGMAMITALVVLMLVTVTGIALTTGGMLAVTISTNDRENNEALAIADAGITHARALLLNQVWINGYDPLLAVSDGNSCSGDELSAAPAGVSSPYPPAAELIPAAGRAYPPGNTFGGQYQVRICDDNGVEATLATPNADPNDDVNGRLLVRSRGVGQNGAEVTVEAVFQDRELPALLVNGNLRMDGSPNIDGAEGAVHANGNLEINGNATCVEQYYSSVGTITPDDHGLGSAACTAAGAVKDPGSEPIPVPKLDLDSNMYKLVADFLLVNGDVYCGPAYVAVGTYVAHYGVAGGTHCGNGVSTYNAATSTWTLKLATVNPGLNWNNGQKAYTGASGGIYPGTYYTDMNVSIAGGNATPKKITIFARGWVDIGGNPNICPDNETAPVNDQCNPPVTPVMPYAIAAGTDLRISGDVGFSPTYTGLYYARDQLEFGGNPDIVGLVVAGNFGDCGWPEVANCGTNNLVPRDGTYITVHGNPHISYDGGSGWMALRRVAWRECRGPVDTNPCGNP